MTFPFLVRDCLKITSILSLSNRCKYVTNVLPRNSAVACRFPPTSFPRSTMVRVELFGTITFLYFSSYGPPDIFENKDLGAQSFSTLMADLRQDILKQVP